MAVHGCVHESTAQNIRLSDYVLKPTLMCFKRGLLNFQELCKPVHIKLIIDISLGRNIYTEMGRPPRSGIFVGGGKAFTSRQLGKTRGISIFKAAHIILVRRRC